MRRQVCNFVGLYKTHTTCFNIKEARTPRCQSQGIEYSLKLTVIKFYTNTQYILSSTAFVAQLAERCNKFAASPSWLLRAFYTCDFARCDCHPGVCNKLIIVYEARYPLMIRCSLSSTLSSVKHILQDVNCKAQNRTCKQSFTVYDSDSRNFTFI